VQRRALLATLPALALKPAPALATTSAPSREAALAGVSSPAPCVVWHAEAVALRWPDGRTEPLPGSPSAAPVAAANGLWLATRDGRLRRWRWRDAWRCDVDLALPAAAHALTASPDGGHVLAAHGRQLRLLDGEGRTLRDYVGTDLARRRSGHAAALLALPRRRSLLAAWPDLHEWWEISLDPAAPPIFDGLVHDHRMGEAIASPGHLGLRRIAFDGPAPLPVFNASAWPWVAARVDDELLVVHLDVRLVVARLQAPGALPAAGVSHAGLWWLPVGAALWGVDPRRWTVTTRRRAPGPVQRLAVAGGVLHALVDGTLWRDEAAGWQVAARGLSALADAEGAMPLQAPPPWIGVVLP
jgi:hypothetical protein